MLDQVHKAVHHIMEAQSALSLSLRCTGHVTAGPNQTMRMLQQYLPHS